MKNDTCVYLHKRLDTNEVFYVGIGNNKRPYDKLQRSKWWNRVVNKVGYEVEVVEKNLPWDSACLIEIALISFFGRRNLGKGTLVNLTDGGGGAKGCICSQKTRSNISKALKGKKKPPMTAETKAKISKAHQGEKGSKAKLTDDIVTEIIYKCKFHYYHGMVRDLAKKYGVHPSTIHDIKKNENWKHINRDSILLKEGDTPTSRLTKENVIEIIHKLKFNYYRGIGKDLAKQYGVHRKTIYNIKNNKTYKHIDRDLILNKK